MRNKSSDPRPGRRPRDVQTGGKPIDIGEANGQSVPPGFEDEPTESLVGGEQRERDVRAPAAPSRDAERLPAKLGR